MRQAHYGDVVAEVSARAGRTHRGRRAGRHRAATGSRSIPASASPRRPASRCELLRRLPELAPSAARSWSASRASRSWQRSPARRTHARRLPGSLAAGLFALSRGASILRVHDVAETVQAIGSGRRCHPDAGNASIARRVTGNSAATQTRRANGTRHDIFSAPTASAARPTRTR